MIGHFSPVLPYNDAPNARVFSPPLTAASSSGGLKRLASSREELERSWHSAGSYSSSARAEVLHSISRSPSDEYDDLDRSFKRQRRAGDFAVESHGREVSGARIHPDNRPPGPVGDVATNAARGMDASRPPVKAGWYRGSVDSVGNRHGRGTTRHDDGTEYDGEYVRDVMEGRGTYRFTAVKQLVSFTAASSSGGGPGNAFLHRVTERVFEGTFVNDKPEGGGMLITTVVDSVPQRVATSGIDVQYVKVHYDVGYYKADGKSAGEGVRFTYARTSMMDGWEESFTRTDHGECTGVKLYRGYAEWICDCLGLTSYPRAPDL